MAYSYFLKFEYPVLINVNNKFCNINLVSGLFQCSVKISRTFYCLCKFYRGGRIEGNVGKKLKRAKKNKNNGLLPISDSLSQ